MSQTTDIESLPPVTLYPNDLREIEAELDERSAEVSISIGSQTGEISSTYDSIDDLLGDPLAPKYVTNYQLCFETDESEGVIHANSTDSDEHTIRLYGDDIWKSEISTTIKSIISSNVNPWKDRFQEYQLRIANLFSTILTGFFSDYPNWSILSCRAHTSDPFHLLRSIFDRGHHNGKPI